MEDITSSKKLIKAWRDLCDDVRRNKIKVKTFDATFSETYKLLSKHLSEGSLDKRYVELVAEAFLFANIKDEGLDYTSLAAVVLTERMLNYCAFNTAPASAEPTTVYIVEKRSEVPLDFNNVGESLYTLAKIFEEIYWDEIP